MSQVQRILDILEDGQWHRTDLLNKATGITRVAARIQDLEEKGFKIDARTSEFYRFKEYRLLPRLEQAAMVFAPSPMTAVPVNPRER